MSQPPKPSGPDFESPGQHGTYSHEPVKGSQTSDAPPQVGRNDASSSESTARYAPQAASQSQYRDNRRPTYADDVNWAPPTASNMSQRSYQPPQAERPAMATRVVMPGGRPVVTYSLIGICVVVWLLQLSSSAFFSSVILSPAIGEFEPWRFLTSAFAHSVNITHILFNMYALWALGQSMEPLLGRWRFLATYLLSAVGGGVMYVLLATPGTLAWFAGVVGASGAVFGLFGALLVFQRFLGANSVGLIAVLLINAVLGFIIDGIAWQAHLGGFLVGMLCAAAILQGTKERVSGRRDTTWWLLGAVFVMIVGVAVIKYLLV